jgi:4-hydroxybenzoate polyprenyltransferase
MSTYLRFLLQISRPKFWLYLAGTYLVGYTAGTTSAAAFFQLDFIVFFIYFLFPANIFLYGINDYFDHDTDQFNEKKGSAEHLLLTTERKQLKITLIGITLGTILLFFIATQLSQILLALFLFLSFAYSALPFRFKAKPIIDFSSNILYGIPGFIGYALTTNSLPTWQIVLAVFCWTSAMHLFSAIPDIKSDSLAKIKTSAVFFGQRLSLIVCGILWLTCVAFSYTYFGYLALIGLIYPTIPLLLLREPTSISKVYWFFPYINALIGFLLFISLL